MPTLPSRRTRAISVVLAALPVLLLFAAMIVGVVSIEGGTVRVGSRRGPWTHVPTWQAQLVALGVLLPLAALFTTRTIGSAARLWRTAPPAEASASLAPGERVVWQGRQGWRGLGAMRVGLAALAAVGPLLYAGWLWHIWSEPDPLAAKLFWSAAATILLGGAAAAPLTLGREATRTFLRDLFGTTVVTDRRIAWLSPRRAQIYREIAVPDLILAAFVEGDERRGWITVTKQADGRVAELDLHGIPHPHEALAAIERLVGPSAIPATAEMAGTAAMRESGRRG